ncbi:hypothetical protein CR513_22319, partial [Mucuna pruriens]
MFKVKMTSKSFSFDPMKEGHIAFPTTTNSIDLWHKRLAYQFGKQIRKSFLESSWRASQKLQLIHIDLARPQRTSSLNMTHVENQSNSRIQILRLDNRKEYVDNQFQQFCVEAGTKHQLIAPYTPQQNGVNERKNRSIIEMARCMLHQKELPKKLYVEASNMIFNMSFAKSNSFQGLVWFCLYYSHVPQVKHDKLDKRVELGVFVGYNTVSRAYRIFQSQIKNFLISRDVHFMEDENWSLKI